ncbi:MAG TPA: hypothetical protein VF939_09110 [Puia sp.]
MASQNYLKTSILAAFAVETLSVTYFLKAPGGTLFFTLLYFIAGIAIAVLLLSFPELKLPRIELRKQNTRLNHYRLIVIGLMALMTYTLCQYWFDEIPLDINYADMLPIIKVMDQRFVDGHWKQIYDNIPSIWNGVQPIYLPSMWQPFVLAVILGIDMRWITVGGLLLAFGIFVFLYRPDPRRYSSFFLGVLAFLLFWWLLADNTSGVITVSEEGVVIAYYTLLALALVSGNSILCGIAVSLCMLSRYALVGWVPAYLLYLLLVKRQRQMVFFCITGLACLLLLFVLPVGWPTFMRLLQLPGNYIKFAGIVWQDSPDVFSTGIGFAGIFGSHRIALLHGILVGLSFMVPSVFIVICCWRGKKKKMANIPLAALKISLVVFYCFIDVPYLYLFYTSSFVSLIALALLMRGDGVNS